MIFPLNTLTILPGNIIGATNLERLKYDIERIDISLSTEGLKEIEEFHREHSNPCPEDELGEWRER